MRAFPEGGGSPEAAGTAFGEEWSVLPIGALVVDFAMTIAISIAGTVLVAALLYWRWVRAGRPRGVDEVGRHGEEQN